MIAWQIDEFEKAFEDPEDEVDVHFSAFISRNYQIRILFFLAVLYPICSIRNRCTDTKGNQILILNFFNRSNAKRLKTTLTVVKINCLEES